MSRRVGRDWVSAPELEAQRHTGLTGPRLRLETISAHLGARPKQRPARPRIRSGHSSAGAFLCPAERGSHYAPWGEAWCGGRDGRTMGPCLDARLALQTCMSSAGVRVTMTHGCCVHGACDPSPARILALSIAIVVDLAWRKLRHATVNDAQRAAWRELPISSSRASTSEASMDCIRSTSRGN